MVSFIKIALLMRATFLGDEVSGEQILYRDRRFVLGKGLVESPALHKFTSEQLGHLESLKFRFPNRSTACVKGSGSRFVHGGAS